MPADWSFPVPEGPGCREPTLDEVRRYLDSLCPYPPETYDIVQIRNGPEPEDTSVKVRIHHGGEVRDEILVLNLYRPTVSPRVLEEARRGLVTKRFRFTDRQSPYPNWDGNDDLVLFDANNTAGIPEGAVEAVQQLGGKLGLTRIEHLVLDGLLSLATEQGRDAPEFALKQLMLASGMDPRRVAAASLAERRRFDVALVNLSRIHVPVRTFLGPHGRSAAYGWASLITRVLFPEVPRILEAGLGGVTQARWNSMSEPDREKYRSQHFLYSATLNLREMGQFVKVPDWVLREQARWGKYTIALFQVLKLLKGDAGAAPDGRTAIRNRVGLSTLCDEQHMGLAGERPSRARKRVANAMEELTESSVLLAGPGPQLKRKGGPKDIVVLLRNPDAFPWEVVGALDSGGGKKSPLGREKKRVREGKKVRGGRRSS